VPIVVTAAVVVALAGVIVAVRRRRRPPDTVDAFRRQIDALGPDARRSVIDASRDRAGGADGP
jgi:hypothetical protein